MFDRVIAWGVRTNDGTMSKINGVALSVDVQVGVTPKAPAARWAVRAVAAANVKVQVEPGA